MKSNLQMKCFIPEPYMQAVYPAQVCGIMKESESVKRLRLTAHPDFNFKAGQWWVETQSPLKKKRLQYLFSSYLVSFTNSNQPWRPEGSIASSWYISQGLQCFYTTGGGSVSFTMAHKVAVPPPRKGELKPACFWKKIKLMFIEEPLQPHLQSITSKGKIHII